jgi:hypothetical protein
MVEDVPNDLRVAAARGVVQNAVVVRTDGAKVGRLRSAQPPEDVEVTELRRIAKRSIEGDVEFVQKTKDRQETAGNGIRRNRPMNLIDRARVGTLTQEQTNTSLGSTIGSNAEIGRGVLKEAIVRSPISRKCPVNIQIVGKEQHQEIGAVGLEAAENVPRGDHLRKGNDQQPLELLRMASRRSQAPRRWNPVT